MKIKRLIPGGFVLVAALLLGGCSSFNRDWKKGVSNPVQPASVAGAWDGSWLSDHNGHTGRLQCLLAENPDGTCQARFRAVYAKVIRVGYTANFRMERATDGETRFKGSADLGWLRGGSYGYEGRIWSTNFFSTYTNKYDFGTFKMHRAHEAK